MAGKKSPHVSRPGGRKLSRPEAQPGLDQVPPLDLLAQGALELGLAISPAVAAAFGLYLEELRRWNARINLTGLKTASGIVIKHFLDSLAVLPYVGEARTLADLGAGPGFPGVPLKLVRPEIQLTLVEGRGKKAAFLEYLVGRLGLAGVEVVPVHLTAAQARAWGPRFDAVTSRGAFPLAQFLKLAAPLLSPGGRALALKGPNLPPADLAAAASLAPGLNLTDPTLHPYQLPLSGEPRQVVMMEKI